MLNLTRQEKQAVLFLLLIGITGLGINFSAKKFACLKKTVTADADIFKINLNQVSLDYLLQCRCLPEKLARSIIEFRNYHGKFTSLEQLKEVKGIGDYRYQKLKEIFLVD